MSENAGEDLGLSTAGHAGLRGEPTGLVCVGAQLSLRRGSGAPHSGYRKRPTCICQPGRYKTTNQNTGGCCFRYSQLPFRDGRPPEQGRAEPWGSPNPRRPDCSGSYRRHLAAAPTERLLMNAAHRSPLHSGPGVRYASRDTLKSTFPVGKAATRLQASGTHPIASAANARFETRRENRRPCFRAGPAAEFLCVPTIDGFIFAKAAPIILPAHRADRRYRGFFPRAGPCASGTALCFPPTAGTALFPCRTGAAFIFPAQVGQRRRGRRPAPAPGR